MIQRESLLYVELREPGAERIWLYRDAIRMACQWMKSSLKQ